MKMMMMVMMLAICLAGCSNKVIPTASTEDGLTGEILPYCHVWESGGIGSCFKVEIHILVLEEEYSDLPTVNITFTDTDPPTTENNLPVLWDLCHREGKTKVFVYVAEHPASVPEQPHGSVEVTTPNDHEILQFPQ